MLALTDHSGVDKPKICSPSGYKYQILRVIVRYQPNVSYELSDRSPKTRTIKLNSSQLIITL